MRREGDGVCVWREVRLGGGLAAWRAGKHCALNKECRMKYSTLKCAPGVVAGVQQSICSSLLDCPWTDTADIKTVLYHQSR